MYHLLDGEDGDGCLAASMVDGRRGSGGHGASTVVSSLSERGMSASTGRARARWRLPLRRWRPVSAYRVEPIRRPIGREWLARLRVPRSAGARRTAKLVDASDPHIKAAN